MPTITNMIITNKWIKILCKDKDGSKAPRTHLPTKSYAKKGLERKNTIITWSSEL